MNIRLVLLCSVVAAAMAADLPYAGKWKVNLAKSDFGQTTVTFESLPGGEWQTTAFGVTYKFKMGGKDYPDNMGGTAAWKSIDANTWELVAKANGKVTETDTFKLDDGGKALTDTAKQMKADGGSIESTTVIRARFRRPVARWEMEDQKGLWRVRDGGNDSFRERWSRIQRSRHGDELRRQVGRQGLPLHRTDAAAGLHRSDEQRRTIPRSDGQERWQALFQSNLYGGG